MNGGCIAVPSKVSLYRVFVVIHTTGATREYGVVAENRNQALTVLCEYLQISRAEEWENGSIVIDTWRTE